MRITKLGHSCLHVQDGQADLLIDPGGFSTGFEALTGLTAVLITHQHPDHLDPTRLPALLAANPQAQVFAEEGTIAQLADLGIDAAAVHAGDTLDDAVGAEITVYGSDHAVIHRDLPGVGNTAFLIGGRLLHPGDALLVPEVDVEILALPVAAPWMALKEAIDYLRAVDAKVAFPIHDATLAPAALGMYYGRFEAMGPAGARWLSLDDGALVDL